MDVDHIQKWIVQRWKLMLWIFNSDMHEKIENIVLYSLYDVLSLAFLLELRGYNLCILCMLSLPASRTASRPASVCITPAKRQA